MAIGKQIFSDLGEKGIRRGGAWVPFGRGCRKKGGENVEAASMGYLYKKFGSEKEGSAWELERMPASRCLCIFEGEEPEEMEEGRTSTLPRKKGDRKHRELFQSRGERSIPLRLEGRRTRL